jgi:hypothetical protein
MKDVRQDPPIRAEDLIGAGRGALVESMFGAGWLGWGLGHANAFNGFSGPAFGLIALALTSCSIIAVRKGRLLKKADQATVSPSRPPILKRFLVVVAIESLAIALASTLANLLHRSDLATDWCAMIVGLHYLPLAKILRAPQLTVLGTLITLWCALSVVLLRSNSLVIAVSIGTGILLWGACCSALFRARGMALALRT